MLVVLDSNIILSALISEHGIPARIVDSWLAGKYRLATCRDQLDEIRSASRYPKMQSVLKRHLVGRMLNLMREAGLQEITRRGHVAEDPTDSYLLDLADCSGCDYLVTGDKRAGLLQRRKVGRAAILSAKSFHRDVLRG
jgi:putative PIN family toxin of toxin-antitoxin system